MATAVIPVPDFDIVVFGGTGDLARRKLLPALFQRRAAGQMPETARVIATSRRAMTSDEFRAFAREAIEEFVHDEDQDTGLLEDFLSRLEYVAVDVSSDEGWSDLASAVRQAQDVIRVFYLAVSPGFFGEICDKLGTSGLVHDETRVVVEKPIGKDLASAKALNDSIARVFSEHQTFRIDHYLGKETVQNLMSLRFANALLEPVWNAAHIDHVQITVAESIGVGSRGAYYDTAGALRDMVQNHILQLLCLVAMEPPSSMDADSVRDEKLKILRALRPIDGMGTPERTVRGQYRAGASDEGKVDGYLDDAGLEESTCETFVALKAEIENWRWSGVPFYLRTGKRMPSRMSEIVIQFQPIPHSIFEPGAGKVEANRLVIRLQPDEGMKLWMMIKDPGPGGMRLRQVPLDMSFAEAFKVRNPDAYERLIMDVVRGNQTLFMRRDEVEAAWSWVDPILQAWSDSHVPPQVYTAGTWGPSSAIALIERDGRTWYDGE